MTRKRTLKDIWEKDKLTTTNIRLEQQRLVRNIENMSTANRSVPVTNKFSSYATDYAHMDELIVSETEQYFYKQFSILLFQGTPDDVEVIAKMLSPNLSSQVIFDETIENPLGFYNTGNEMKVIKFYELKDTDLTYNVAVYLSKPFGGAELVNPQIKLDITVKNYVQVRN